MENPPLKPEPSRRPRLLPAMLIFCTILAVGVWLYLTPPGLLGKADAAGYAVCHRIADRSFSIGDRQTPLCARCSGMYLGALLGFGYLGQFGRRAGMPPLKVSVLLAIFLGAFAVDGANSYLHLFPLAPGLYEPHNIYRLLTGTGLGLGIAAVLVPVIHQSLWRTYDPRPALAGFRQMIPLIGLAVLVDVAVLSEVPLLLYPLAVMSAGSIFIVLSLVYMVVWIMVTKQDNRLESYRQLKLPLTAGFLTALAQIALIDAGRFWLTGTWGGFIF